MLSLFVLLTGAAIAADQTASLEEIVVTATRSQRSVTELVAAVARVDAKDTSVPLLATEFFAYQPGAYVQQTTPGQGNVIIRGLKGSAVLNLVDGMRLNNALFRSAPNQYPALVDASWIDAVEVARGPVSVLYGSDALSGAAQFLLRRPSLSDSARSRLRVQVDSASNRWGADAEMNFALRQTPGDHGTVGSVAASYRDVGDRRVGGGNRIRSSGYRSHAARAVVLSTSKNSEWQIDLQFAEQPETPRVDELVPGFGQVDPSSSIFAFEPNRRTALHARYETAVDSSVANRIRADVSWQRIDDNRRTQNFGSTNQRRERNSSELFQAVVLAEGGDDSWLYSYGAEATSDDISSQRLEDQGGATSVSVPSRFSDGSNVMSAGIVAYVERAFESGVAVTGGARASYFDVDLGGNEGASGSDVTAQLGLSVPIRGARWVSNVGRGFRAPNVFDFSNLGDRPGNRFNIPNGSLDPETVISVDTGFRWEGEQWRGEVIAFSLSYQDRITSISTGELTAGGREVVQSRNVAESDIRGVEASVAGQWNDRWSLQAVLNYAHGEDTELDVETAADRIPPLNGRLGLTFNVSDALRLEAYTLFASRQDRLSPRDLRDPRINPGGTAGWATVNLRAVYQPSENWSVDLGLRNLFDRRYREHASGLDAEGLNLSLGLEFRS